MSWIYDLYNISNWNLKTLGIYVNTIYQCQSKSYVHYGNIPQFAGSGPKAGLLPTPPNTLGGKHCCHWSLTGKEYFWKVVFLEELCRRLDFWPDPGHTNGNSWNLGIHMGNLYSHIIHNSPYISIYFHIFAMGIHTHLIRKYMGELVGPWGLHHPQSSFSSYKRLTAGQGLETHWHNSGWWVRNPSQVQ